MSAEMGEYMRGSIEIISNGNSIGMVVNLRDADAVPVVVEAGQSLTDVVSVEVPRDGVDAEWTAVTEDGFDAVVLWREERDVVPDMPAGEDEGE
ncbi:MAG TPA: hypothetical protein VKZ96_16060 [Thermomicrobiales bacterium]|nr:hypothetical protein [Thermomicrobiales bacterium]